MFGWLKKRKQTLQPEALWRVLVNAHTISVIDAEEGKASFAKADLMGVIIETNDTGPWGADVWWLLLGANDQVVGTFPQGATGEQQAVDYLMSLPGFDHSAMFAAMASTQNAVFSVWRRPPA